MTSSRSRPPSELWLFAGGFAIYSALPLLPQLPRLPANPIGFLVVAAAINLMTTKSRRGYWVTVALGFMALCYPILVSSSWWPVLGHRSLIEVYYVLLTPALLLCLPLSGRVRRYLRPADSTSVS